MSVHITNIQRYAIHDGVGIRTTVFFKGCPLSCSWCHNPETQGFDGQSNMSNPAELARLLLRDMAFFGVSNGGVTLSGGEPLAVDTEFMVELLKILKQHHVNIAVDTCGDVPWENFEHVLPYVDMFLYDIKLASAGLHLKYTGRGNERVIGNLTKLARHDGERVWLRVPVIGGVNDGAEMRKIIDLAKDIVPGCKVTLLPYHTYGKDKWAKLGKPAPDCSFYTPPDSRIKEIESEWKWAGFFI